jgi:hypothetical protein
MSATLAQSIAWDAKSLAEKREQAKNVPMLLPLFLRRERTTDDATLRIWPDTKKQDIVDDQQAIVFE